MKFGHSKAMDKAAMVIHKVPAGTPIALGKHIRSLVPSHPTITTSMTTLELCTTRTANEVHLELHACRAQLARVVHTPFSLQQMGSQAGTRRIHTPTRCRNTVSSMY